jgi:hypothetical protein
MCGFFCLWGPLPSSVLVVWDLSGDGGFRCFWLFVSARPGSERDVPSRVAHAGAGVKTRNAYGIVPYRVFLRVFDFFFRASWLGTGRPVARSARRCGRENAKRVRDRPVQGFFYRPLDFLPVPGGNGIYRGIPLEFKFQTKTDSYR